MYNYRDSITSIFSLMNITRLSMALNKTFLILGIYLGHIVKPKW